MNQSQIYQQLELIPDSVTVPLANKHIPAQLVKLWQELIKTFTEKLSYQQRVEHLERSLALECSSSSIVTWQTIWTFLNQPLSVPSLFTSPEPEMWIKLDRDGNTWWYVRDPITGQKTVLDSEQQVQIWLEEHRR